MARSEKRTFDLRAEQVSYIDALVDSGVYANASEVVQASLNALLERDEAARHALQEEVVPVAAAMTADPNRAIPAEQVFANLRALHTERLRTGSR